MAEPQSVNGAPGLSSAAVLVTEKMIPSAVLDSNLESLMIWATQGVRVTTGEPLFVAAFKLASSRTAIFLRCLVQDLGADVNHTYRGVPPLLMAVTRGDLAVVRCLVELGADIGALSVHGDSALHVSARNGHYLTVQYLLEASGANIEDITKGDVTVWDLLTDNLENAKGSDSDDDSDEEEVEKEDPVALIGLLRVMVLHRAPPPTLVALLSPKPACVMQEGAWLRARLPAYITHRRAYLDLNCSRISLLPGVLQALVHGFEGSAATDELWATGLGTAS
jgi:hypothetical protein